MPQKETLPSGVERYMHVVEKGEGKRIIFEIPVSIGVFAMELAEDTRRYMYSHLAAYTLDEERFFVDSSLQVYVHENSSLVVASRAYMPAIEGKVLKEAEEIADYAYKKVLLLSAHREKQSLSRN